MDHGVFPRILGLQHHPVLAILPDDFTDLTKNRLWVGGVVDDPEGVNQILVRTGWFASERLSVDLVELSIQAENPEALLSKIHAGLRDFYAHVLRPSPNEVF